MYFLSPCVCRTMQDMENPQVTSCNKGDQHYRSSPSNQSSSSDPGPCASTWSQQPGYDGYRTTALLFFNVFLKWPLSSPSRNMWLRSNECSDNQSQRYFWELAILQNDSNFSTWNDQIISALLASRHSFLQEVIKLNDEMYACHGLVPHPDLKERRRRMMSFMYDFAVFHYTCIVIVSIQSSKTLI